MDMGLKLKNRKVWYLFYQKSCHSHLFIVCIDFGGSHLCHALDADYGVDC
jgi:hypothetical protein